LTINKQGYGALQKRKEKIDLKECQNKVPTVMKNRPNKRPRYGAISDSTCKENSVSARSNPAKNAPNAMESPACSRADKKRNLLLK
jgi:hypothetical protein